APVPTPTPDATASPRSTANTLGVAIPGTVTYISRMVRDQRAPDLVTIGPDARLVTVPLTRLPDFDSTASPVSPDHKNIAWINGSTGQLEIANVDGTQRHTVAARVTYPCGSPMWSPDSTKVAFGTGDTSHTQVEVVDADGSSRHVLDAQGGCHPTWSVNASTIAYTVSATVVTINSDGTGRRTVPTTLSKQRVRTIMSISATGKAAVDLLGTKA